MNGIRQNDTPVPVPNATYQTYRAQKRLGSFTVSRGELHAKLKAPDEAVIGAVTYNLDNDTFDVYGVDGWVSHEAMKLFLGIPSAVWITGVVWDGKNSYRVYVRGDNAPADLNWGALFFTPEAETVHRS